jgi:2-keto-4-pentenoate hydratase/2-oxohepta-3-ene-1,7-dioic acid hydratase in catechol pathway
MSFALATISTAGSAAPVLIADERLYPLMDLMPELAGPGPTGGSAASTDRADGLMRVLANWTAAEPRLAAIVDDLRSGMRTCPDVAAPERAEDWLTPLQYPAKVICTGANYFDHITKDGGHASFTKADNIPVFFLKPPTTTLVGQGRSVRFPVQSERFDYEVELAVVIGKGGRHIEEDAALDHVAGYTIGLDLSARDWQRHPKHLVNFDLFGGKAFDDSCPLGPGIVPARFVDHADVRLRLWVNGDLRQDANSADMIWSVPELIARISEHVTLEPGDVILTGTPSGVGLATGTWLQVGDVIDCEISGLGSMRVEIVDDHQEADRRSGR